MAYHEMSGDDAERFADLFGPAQIDQVLRQAIQVCWAKLPKCRRTPDEVEKHIRRIVDRALRDFREDHQAFQGDESS